ncbi:caspase domain-containing protein [Lactarius deliciosus]|nr:caspase domain-containing protein [Lactarius deliciosus]
MGSFLSSIYSRYFSFCFRRFNQVINPNGRIRLPDVEEGKQQGTSNGPTTKRRALLVGISYAWSQSDLWWRLDNPHADVDLFWSLLVGVYGYFPEDIIVLKDGPNTPDLRQPTRANIIRELERLVSGAASGDKFTFFYSGHSDQQKSRDGLDVEEDGQDEVIVTSDLGRIVDNDLHDILSVFDTCHSGTMLDLPHHHCNGVYVPWHSKGERAMPTMRNKIVRNYAIGPSALHNPAFQIPSIVGVMARNIDNNIRLYTDPLPSPCAQLRIDTQVGGSADETNRRWMSMGDPEGYPPREGRRLRSGASLVSPTRYESPVSIVNFALHENARELHAYTREQKKREARGEGNGFDGELDNFQEPKLSSLAKLNMDDVFHL